MDIYSASSVSLLELRLTQIVLHIMLKRSKILGMSFLGRLLDGSGSLIEAVGKTLTSMWSVVKRTQVVYSMRSQCCCCSAAKLSLTLCYPMDCSTPGLPVVHFLLEFVQIHMH